MRFREGDETRRREQTRALRSVKGGSEADLDMRAITTEDDIIDLDTFYGPQREDDAQPHETDHSRREHLEDSRGRPGSDSDEEFDQWASQSARRVDVPASAATSRPGTARLPGQLRAPEASRASATTTTRAPSPEHPDPAQNQSARHRWSVPHLAPIAARTYAVGGVVMLLIGLGATAAVLLTQRDRQLRPRRAPVASAVSSYASDARSLAAEKRAFSLSLERLTAGRQAAQRRARTRAERQRTRAKVHHAQPPSHTVYAASTAPSTRPARPAPAATPSVHPAGSPPATSSIRSSPPAGPAHTTPAPAAAGPSSSGGASTSHQTSQSSASSQQPAFGSSGSLAPGSSPDG